MEVTFPQEQGNVIAYTSDRTEHPELFGTMATSVDTDRLQA